MRPAVVHIEGIVLLVYIFGTHINRLREKLDSFSSGGETDLTINIFFINTWLDLL